MVNKIQGIDYETALANLRASSLELRGDLPEKNELLSQFHPDYQAKCARQTAHRSEYRRLLPS